ncbi:MAG: FkbM family methyltransferase [Pseudomonadota bacterium]
MPSTALSGVFRSLRQYHGDPARAARMRALYAQFIGPGDLAFDIGAHVGDRTSVFRALGARVVTLEPQPLLMRALRLIHGRDAGVMLTEAACAATEGKIQLRINDANPTVSTASGAFITAADGAAGWEGQCWRDSITVPCTTLDALLAAHGEPGFVKIDVEGFEADVLAGLSRPLPALSFEFTTIQREVALRCLERLALLGDYRFALSLGESHVFTRDTPIGASDMAALVTALPHEANSGDIYALLQR